MAKKVSELLAELDSELDSAQGRITEDVTNYEARLAALQAKIDAGEASDADIAAAEAIKAKIAGIDPTNPNVFPE